MLVLLMHPKVAQTAYPCTWYDLHSRDEDCSDPHSFHLSCTALEIAETGTNGKRKVCMNLYSIFFLSSHFLPRFLSGLFHAWEAVLVLTGLKDNSPSFQSTSWCWFDLLLIKWIPKQLKTLLKLHQTQVLCKSWRENLGTYGIWKKATYNEKTDRRTNNLPCKSLYRFYQHSINPKIKSLVKLVQREELDVLVDDDGGSTIVDTVPTIFTRKSGLFIFKQDPEM